MNIENFKELQKAHFESTKPMDENDAGFYNGIEYVLCLMEKREPVYKDVERPSRRKRELESLIAGHMEAMRPLLDEWAKTPAC